MNSLQIKVMEASLNKMWSQQYFSICTVDACLKLTGGKQGGPIYDMLHALHCVPYTQMDKDVVAALPAMVAEVLRLPLLVLGPAKLPADTVEMPAATPAAKPSIFNKLLLR